MSFFEEGTGTGRKTRSFNFCSSSFTYLFPPGVSKPGGGGGDGGIYSPQ